jgi:hypothetical protein
MYAYVDMRACTDAGRPHSTLPLFTHPIPPSADPTEAELKAGANLQDARKCTCGSRYCAPVAYGRLPFAASAGLRDVVTLSGELPANPYEPLRDATSTSLVCAAPCEYAGSARQRM